MLFIPYAMAAATATAVDAVLAINHVSAYFFAVLHLIENQSLYARVDHAENACMCEPVYALCTVHVHVVNVNV